MKLNIEPLSQKDSRWRYKKLGTSTVTLGTSGCVLTCLSMLCTYYKHPVFPDQLNDMLVNINGFANQNLMKWEVLTLLFPDIHWDQRLDCPNTPAPLDIVDDYLGQSKPVVALVDFDPNTPDLQQHFVLVIGKDNNDYFINDPWTGETYFLSAKYGEPAKAICGLRLYSGPVVVQEEHYQVVYKGQVLASYERNPIDTIDTLDKKLEGARTNLAQEIQNNTALQAILTQQEKDNADLLAHLRDVEKSRDEAIADLRQVEGLAHDILGIEECTADGFRAVKEAVKGLTGRVSELEEQLKLTQNEYQVVARLGRYLVVKKDGKQRG